MMKIFDKPKLTTLFTLIAALALFSGCDREKEPAIPEIDLSQTDLTEQPLQPSPFALNPEDVIVTVDGEEITHGNVMQGAQMMLMQLGRQVPPQQLGQLAGQAYQNTREQMIANILLRNAADKSSLAVSDEDFNAQLDKIRANAPEGNTLEATLAEQEIDFEEWKTDLRKQLLVEELIKEQVADIKDASTGEAAQFYQENIERFKIPENVSANHILLTFEEGETEEAKAEKLVQAEKIHADLLAGKDFAALAEEHSDCPSGTRGGDLGTFGRGQMVPEFEEAAFAQEPGTIGNVIETQFGYHIIKVTDHKEASIQPLSDVQEQLLAFLTTQKKQEALEAYVEALKEKADIQFPQQNILEEKSETSAAE